MHAREISLKLIDEIRDPEIRRIAQTSLRQNADMNLMVRAFHKVYGLPIIPPAKAKEDFSHISKERLAMRFGLIVEEFMELCEAMDIRADINFFYQDVEEKWAKARSTLETKAETTSEKVEGVNTYQNTKGQTISVLDHSHLDDEALHKIARERAKDAIMNTDERSMPDIADACFDLKYVLIGFEYEIGIEPQFCAEEGQASNMSKLDVDGTVIYREDGKVLKGPKFFRPDMARALKSWGMRDV